MPKSAGLSLIVVLSAVAAIAAADLDTGRSANWHQWRGPNSDGVSPQGDPPVEWSEEQNVRWKVPVPGKGSATPVVWGDRIFVLTAVPAEGPARAEADTARPRRGTAQAAQPGQRGGRRRGPGGGGGFGNAPPSRQQFMVLCFDRTSGDVVWQRVVAEELPHEGHHQTNTFASASAVTDGERVFASFGSRGIYCLNMDGEVQWERDLGDMQTRNGFGEGSTPALHEDTLVVTWDHEQQSAIYALDARTGEIRWQKERDEPTTWATPLIVEHEGRTQVVTNGTNRVRSYALESGELIWECGGQVSNPIATPLVVEGMVIATTGHRGNALYAIPLDATGDVTDTRKIAWSTNEIGSYIASPLVYRGLLYVTKGRDAIISCFDAKTGKQLSGPERMDGLNTLYASPAAAADRLYYIDRNGTCLVLKAGPEFEVLATNRLDEGVDASPVIVGKQMFLRGEKHLYCLEETSR